MSSEHCGLDHLYRIVCVLAQCVPWQRQGLANCLSSSVRVSAKAGSSCKDPRKLVSCLMVQISIVSAVSEKRITSGKRGLHFQPVPPKVHPVAPREVHGCSRFWKRVGSEFLALDVWPLGPRPAGSGICGHNEGVPCGAWEAAANPARPMAPAVPRAPWTSPLAIPVAGSARRLFGIFLAHRGGTCARGPKQ